MRVILFGLFQFYKCDLLEQFLLASIYRKNLVFLHKNKFLLYSKTGFTERILENTNLHLNAKCNALLHYRKMKFSVKDFFSKCKQIHSFLRIYSHLLKTLLTQNVIKVHSCGYHGCSLKSRILRIFYSYGTSNSFCWYFVRIRPSQDLWEIKISAKLLRL